MNPLCLAACLMTALCLWSGCIRAPEIVLVDRATVLEQQAAGSFTDLERKLSRDGISGRPVPLTPEQLHALGIRQPPLVDTTELTDADLLDGLLKQRCIGEARDGTLVETRDSCQGVADRALAVTLIDQANRARQQLWRWMHDRQQRTPAAEQRRAWWQAHLRGVVCGGWVQREDGTWEAKQC